MADDTIAIDGLAGVPDARLAPTRSPYLVRVIVPIATGTVDEAVRQAGLAAQDLIDASLSGIRAEIATDRRRARLGALILG